MGTYTKKIQIEARVIGDLATEPHHSCCNPLPKQVGKERQFDDKHLGREEGERLTARNVKILKEIAERMQAIETGVDELVEARKIANRIENQREKSHCLPRQYYYKDGRDTPRNRQARTDCERRNVDVAEIS